MCGGGRGQGRGGYLTEYNNYKQTAAFLQKSYIGNVVQIIQHIIAVTTAALLHEHKRHGSNITKML